MLRESGWRLYRLFLAGLLVLAGLGMLTPPAEATIRVGNSEIQVVYEMQHAFQFDGDPTAGMEWVQWRNELRVEYELSDLVTPEGGLFDKNIKIPGVRRAELSLIYRGRFDPVYIVRDKYDDMYPNRIKNQFKGYTFPENGFREINLHVDFGEVFGYRTSMKLGKQQIVWGESDLFRSIDIVNPLGLNQNQAIGEAFEDFRTPIWAAKFLIDIGNVGTFASNVGLEFFYTPRWRPITQNLIYEGAWGGVRYDDPNYVGDPSDYFDSPTSPGVLTTRGVPWAPYRKWSHVRHPFSLGRVGRNTKNAPGDAGCSGTGPCSDDALGRSGNFVYRIGGGKRTHMIRGTKWINSMAGVRLMGKIFSSVDFSLNYIFKRTDPGGVFHFDTFFGHSELNADGKRPAGLDANITGTPGGLFINDPTNPNNMANLRRSLDRCYEENEATFFLGLDMYGYSQDGNPDNDRSTTACFDVSHWYPWTHVFGLTMTYNDFDYTGMVFRLEQSWSTNEPRNRLPVVFRGSDQEHYDARLDEAQAKAIAEGKTGSQIPTNPFEDGDGNPCADATNFCPSPRARINRIKFGSSIWRSMIGFDLIQSLQSFPGMQWTKKLPGGIGDQATFYTFQALTTYTNNNRTGLDQVFNAAQNRINRWDQLYTVATSGFYFRGKLEPLFAFAYSVNAKQPLILAQTFWHGLFFRNLDLFVGSTMYLGSRNDVDGTALNIWAERDSFWFRLQYYIL